MPNSDCWAFFFLNKKNVLNITKNFGKIFTLISCTFAEWQTS